MDGGDLFSQETLYAWSVGLSLSYQVKKRPWFTQKKVCYWLSDFNSSIWTLCLANLRKLTRVTFLRQKINTFEQNAFLLIAAQPSGQITDDFFPKSSGRNTESAYQVRVLYNLSLIIEIKNRTAQCLADQQLLSNGWTKLWSTCWASVCSWRRAS